MEEWLIIRFNHHGLKASASVRMNKTLYCSYHKGPETFTKCLQLSKNCTLQCTLVLNYTSVGQARQNRSYFSTKSNIAPTCWQEKIEKSTVLWVCLTTIPSTFRRVCQQCCGQFAGADSWSQIIQQNSWQWSLCWKKLPTDHPAVCHAPHNSFCDT